jgi:integrase
VISGWKDLGKYACLARGERNESVRCGQKQHQHCRIIPTTRKEDILFRNTRGAPLTRDGVAYVLAKYVRLAAQTSPALAKRRVTPHVMRHSCAVALLQAGVDVSVIRDYLGHASVTTTSRYITTNLQMKRKTTLAANTKADYKNGRRLILKTPLSGMRMDQITADDVETTKFHESPHSRNCAIRTLRRMLGKARDWKVLREVPRIKTVKVFPRDRMVTVEDEKRLLAACKRPLKNVLTIMLDSGLRNGEVVRMRWETINWEGAFYFNPRGKTRKARRPVPLSERVLTLLRNIQHEESDRREGWVFASKKSRSGHIGLSGLARAHVQKRRS